MEITVGLFLLIVAAAALCELLDCSVGMGYGTILSPLLLIVGFEPLAVIPAVLLSQAFGSLSASIFHHQYNNVDFSWNSRDLRLFFLIGGLGVLAVIFAAITSLNVPKLALKSYIGALVMVMGVVILLRPAFRYSWQRMVGIGILSAFNKGLSGGGFGPVVTGGLILSGQEHKTAIGVTTLAEAPICISGFLAYVIGKATMVVNGPVLAAPLASFVETMFMPRVFHWELILGLTIGSLISTPLGPLITRFTQRQVMRYVVGGLIALLGAWSLADTWL